MQVSVFRVSFKLRAVVLNKIPLITDIVLDEVRVCVYKSLYVTEWDLSSSLTLTLTYHFFRDILVWPN